MRRRIVIHLVAAFALLPAAGATEAVMDENTSQDYTDRLMSEGRANDLHQPVNDLRLGGSLLSAPQIRETVDIAGGGSANYDWIGGNHIGGGVGVSYMRAWWPSIRGGAGTLIGGLGVVYQHYNTTPQSYRTVAGLATNTNKSDLQYQVAAAELALGWANQPVNTVVGDLHLEALGVGSFGIAWADTQVGGSNATRRGTGTQWAIGPRLGMYLCEAHWVFGVHGDWTWSRGKVDIALPGGDTSHIEAVGQGPSGTAEIGYRF
jgi:hypothetical protein